MFKRQNQMRRRQNSAPLFGGQNSGVASMEAVNPLTGEAVNVTAPTANGNGNAAPATNMEGGARRRRRGAGSRRRSSRRSHKRSGSKRRSHKRAGSKRRGTKRMRGGCGCALSPAQF